MENKYYIIDFGVDMETIAKETIARIKEKPNTHVVIYETPGYPNGFMVTETSEDDFLLHFASKLSEQ